MNTDAPRSRKEQVLELMRASRLAEAGALCEEVVRNENNAGAWHLLGVIHGMQDNARDAERCSREAIRLRPDYAEAHNNLGAALRVQGRLDEAILSLREALRLQPAHVEAHYNLGLALAAERRFDEAIESLREVVRLKPDRAEAHLYLGAALASTGRFEEAVASFRRVLTLHPGHAAAHVYLGNVFVDMGRMEEAVANYRQALQQQPREPETLNNLGNALSELGRKDEAIAVYRQILEYDPRYLAAYHNLGRTLLDLGRATEAEGAHRNALRAVPNHPNVLADLGVALACQGKHQEAIACYRRALADRPSNAETHYNLGNALHTTGKLDEAIESYRTALRLAPENADAHVNLGMIYLSRGNFRNGWDDYDWQWRREGAPVRPFPPSAWDGTDLGGKDVFLRFVPWLKKQGASRIVYSPTAKIRSLLSRSRVLDRLAMPNERPTGAELVFSVGDLPRLLGMERTDQIPPPLELMPMPAQIATARQQLSQCGPPPYVGVTWRGGTMRKNAVYKETPRERLAACLRDISATVVVLQRNSEAGEVQAFARVLGRPVHDFSALNEDLERMLALLSLLDEYVGVSNTNMHLRAGVGKTARVLVPAPPEWRWMAEGKESPWFPGFRVYRQAYDNNWDRALADLGHDLAAALPVH